MRLVTRLTLTPGASSQLVAGDGRADGHADEVRVDAVLVQGPLEDRAGFVGGAPVGFRGAGPSEQLGGGQLPGAGPAAAGDVEGHLPAGFLDHRDRGQVGLGGLGGGGRVDRRVALEVVELGEAGHPVAGRVGVGPIVGGVGVGRVGARVGVGGGAGLVEAAGAVAQRAGGGDEPGCHPPGRDAGGEERAEDADPDQDDGRADGAGDGVEAAADRGAEVAARASQRGDGPGDGRGAVGEVEEPDHRAGQEDAADPDPKRRRLPGWGGLGVPVGGRGEVELGVGDHGGATAGRGEHVEAGQPAEEADDRDRVAGLADEGAERVGEALPDRAGQVRGQAEAGEDGEDEQRDAGRVASVPAELAAGRLGQLPSGRLGLSGSGPAGPATDGAGPAGAGPRALRPGGGAGRHRVTLTPASKASADTVGGWRHWVGPRGLGGGDERGEAQRAGA